MDTAAPESDAPDPLIGQTLGGYEITDELASGGMGKVYLARHTRLEKTVALKVLLGAMKEVAEYVERFHREALLAARLEHPNIVRIYDYGQEEDILYLVMQYVEGESLADRMERQERFPLKEALHICREIAKGLDIAHESGLVHRDIKPDNILLSKRGEVMITDFGLVKRDAEKESAPEISTVLEEDADAELTMAGSFVGTPVYMAPEQCQGLSDIDQRADIYSLGLILYGLVTGDLPVRGTSAMEIMQNRLLEDPTPPVELNPNIPPGLNKLIMDMLAREPDQRVPRARIVIEALERIRAQIVSGRRGRKPQASYSGRRPAAPRPTPPGRPGTRSAAPLAPPQGAQPRPPAPRPPEPPPPTPAPAPPPAPTPPPAPPGPPGWSRGQPPPQSLAPKPKSKDELISADLSDEDIGFSDFAGADPGQVDAQPPEAAAGPPLTDSYASSGVTQLPPASPPSRFAAGARYEATPPPAPPASTTVPDRAVRDTIGRPLPGYDSQSSSRFVGTSQPARPGGGAAAWLKPALLFLLLGAATAAPFVWLQYRPPPPLTLLEFNEVPEWTTSRTFEIAGRASNPPVLVTIDGEETRSASDGQFRRFVKLEEGPNAIEVTLKDGDGQTLVKSVTVNLDTDSPVLTLLEDDGKSVVLDESRTLRGRVEDRNEVTVFVAGKRVDVDAEGRFACALGGEDEVYKLKVSARDLAGNVSTQPVTAIVRKTLEFTTLEAPAAWSETPEAEIRGELNRPAESLTLDGEAVELEEGLRFRIPLRLENAAKTYLLQARAEDGGQRTQEITAGYDSRPPSITVINPQPVPGKVFFRPDDLLRGRVLDDGPVTLTLNGEELGVIEDGSFIAPVRFEGKESVELTLEARDRVGRIAQQSLLVYAPEHLSWLEAPTAPKRTRDAQLTLEGRLCRGPATASLGEVTTAIGRDGQFCLTLDLIDGVNALELVITNPQGGRLSSSFSVRFDPNPPEILLEDERLPGIVPLGEGGRLRGRIRDDDLKVRFEVAGTPVSLGEEGRFEAPIALEGGGQLVSLRVVDAVGLETVREVYVAAAASYEREVARAALADFELWQRVGAELQDRAIELAAAALPETYSFVSTKRYDCAGLSTRIARFRHERTGIELHLIPGGSFIRGSSLRSEEGPVAELTLAPFLIGRTEVTQGQWDVLDLTDARVIKGRAMPIQGVSWKVVSRWLATVGDGLRLPSETEWERAARGGVATPYFWGEEFDPIYCWYRGNSDANTDRERRPHAVSEHEGRPNAFGLVDVLGNVKEWCADSYAPTFAGAPSDNGARQGAGAERAVRGGGWNSERFDCRSAARRGHTPDHRYGDLGFRAARDLPWSCDAATVAALRKGFAEARERSAAPASTRQILADLETWNAAGAERQDQAILGVSKRLQPHFSFKETRDFECAGQKTRIALYEHGATGIQLCLVPGGLLKMGSDLGDDDEQPVHDVRVEPFLISRFELLQREWEKLGGGPAKVVWKGAAIPLHGVSWNAARAALDKAQGGLRLPSEAEWEWAARAGTSTDYFWGAEMNPRYCWFDKNAAANSTREPWVFPAPYHESLTNAFGLSDVLGNVREWVEDDAHKSYRGAPRDARPWVDAPRASERIARGGSYLSYARDCRATDRQSYGPDHDFKDVGFRVAVSIPGG